MSLCLCGEICRKTVMEPSPEKWEKVKALFEAALEPEPAAAAAFLAEACPDDEIRKEVERLLANRPQLDGFLSEAVLQGSAPTPVPRTGRH